MINLYSSFKYLIGKILEKYYSLNLRTKVLLIYLFILIPFLYFHERHLPIWIILVLLIFALIFSLILGLMILKILSFLYEREFNLWLELGFYFLNFTFYFFIGLFDKRAGIILLIFCVLIYLPFRLQKDRVFYRIAILGTIALTTSLTTFQILRVGEWLLFHLQLKMQQEKIEIDIDSWELDGKKLSHKEIPMSLYLSENMFFHKPSKTLGEYRGTGTLLGIISNSDSDPNIYPYIRIYFIPKLFYVDMQTLEVEFEKYLEFEKNQGDIESIQNFGEHTIQERYKGKFWVFYDNLRPKNVKAGFYFIPLKNSNIILFEIREKLSENEFHVTEIQEILDKMKIEE